MKKRKNLRIQNFIKNSKKKKGCGMWEVQKIRGNITKFAHTGAGRQRFKRKTCKGIFTETRGTIFYCRCTDENEILECLAMIAEGLRISGVARIKGHKEKIIKQPQPGWNQQVVKQ
ncbi:MAG: hypothetical protein D3924_17385 [Candidatus Electrothrix sp. AR4]|nr:hypothetical protein [Candidatus Electrothrix sp. AR4]